MTGEWNFAIFFVSAYVGILIFGKLASIVIEEEISKAQRREEIRKRQQQQQQTFEEIWGRTADIFRRMQENDRVLYNSYQVLGVPHNASKAEIESKYRKLQIQYHPDKNLSNPLEAKKKFIEVTKAYETIRDFG